jgi:thiaminase/transcriptional activator TenA
LLVKYSAEELWQLHYDLGLKSLNCDFVQGLLARTPEETLSVKKFAHYIAQDTSYLEVYSQAYAFCLAKSPTKELVYKFYIFLKSIFEELELHKGLSTKWNHNTQDADHTLLPATVAYTSFLLECGNTQPLPCIVAAILPCARLYAFVGEELKKSLDSEDLNPPEEFQRWINKYGGGEFLQVTKEIEDTYDEIISLKEYQTEEIANLCKHNYLKAMELEFDFFNEAYQ